jgi:thiamine-phosphate diphosphorylase
MTSVGRLHLVTNLSVSLEAIDAAVTGGVDTVHVRDHAARAGDLLERGRRLRERLGGRARLIVNDRLDVALALGADGVQLGSRSLPVDEARRLAPAIAIGASVHSLAEARVASRADWLLLGTVFPSTTHPGGATIGPEGVGEIAAAGLGPIVAIGGITAENALSVLRAGAHGVAVISAVLAAPSPRDAARRLHDALQGAPAERGQDR